MNPSDITLEHRSRLACVYIRQSTRHQVLNHRESQRRQRTLVERPKALGWPQNRIKLIDDDLALSAEGGRRRPSFEALVADITMGTIGLIVGSEVSRLSRANRHWYYLLDICAVTRTIIADAEGLYDPRLFNDRLLLGMKATMSEYELHLIHQRLVEAMRAKAKRGEFQILLPPGLMWDERGRIRKSPDAQVATAIELVFQRFLELGTINQTFASLADDEIELPVRAGPKGRIEWRPASYQRVQRIVTNPSFGGAYVYGRRQIEETLDTSNQPVKRTRAKGQSDWHVLIKDHHEGYVSWETFEKIQKQIQANRRCPTGVGAPREGPALLQGLVMCGRCGRHMKLRYYMGGREFRYDCRKGRDNLGGEPCYGFGGKRIERAVEKLVLQALEPVGLEAMIRAVALHAETYEAQRRHWEQKLERARYEVDLARRQYEAVDPANRLVAHELEKRFEESLRALEAMKAETEAHVSQLDAPLCREDEAQLIGYAQDLPALWNAPTTRQQDRKRLVRCLIRHVVLTATEEGERLKAEIHWSGGEVTKLEFPRVTRARTATTSEVIELVRDLAQEFSDGQIARILQRRGIRTATGLPFNTHRLFMLRRNYDIQPGPKVPKKGDNVYTAEEAAEIFHVSRPTIIRWVEDGLLQGTQRSQHAPWRIRVTEEDRRRLTAADAPQDWLTLKAAAGALGVSQQTVLQRLKVGKLKGVRIRVGRRSAWRIQVPEGTYDRQLSLFE